MGPAAEQQRGDARRGRRFYPALGVVYAECGGLMYLAETVRTQDGATWPMVGALPITIVMTDRLQRFGYGRGRFDA